MIRSVTPSQAQSLAGVRVNLNENVGSPMLHGMEVEMHPHDWFRMLANEGDLDGALEEAKKYIIDKYHNRIDDKFFTMRERWERSRYHLVQFKFESQVYRFQDSIPEHLIDEVDHSITYPFDGFWKILQPKI